jgi:hypothetical protein
VKISKSINLSHLPDPLGAFSELGQKDIEERCGLAPFYFLNSALLLGPAKYLREDTKSVLCAENMGHYFCTTGGYSERAPLFGSPADQISDSGELLTASNCPYPLLRMEATPETLGRVTCYIYPCGLVVLRDPDRVLFLEPPVATENAEEVPL